MLTDRLAAVGMVNSDGADAWLIQDHDGTVLSMETAAGSPYWIDPSFAVGLAGRDLVHPEDAGLVQKRRNLARDGRGDQVLHFRVRRSGARWLWVEGRFRAVADTNGAEGRLTVVSLRDVSIAYLERETSQLVAELQALILAAGGTSDALANGIARVARLAGCSAAIVWESTDDGPAVEHAWSEGAEGARFVASRRFAVCIEPAASVLGRTWTTGQATESRFASVCTSGIVSERDGERLSLLLPVRSKDITVAVIELVQSDTPRDQQRIDLVTAAVGHLGDAFLRRRLEDQLETAEQRFRLTFEEAAIGMALVEPDGKLMAANQALCDFLGRDQDELRANGIHSVTHSDDFANGLPRVRELLAGERTSYQLEKRYLHADGATKWGSLSVSLVRDPSGAPLHFVAQVTDIDARKKAEELRDRAEHDLHEAVATFRAAFDDSAIGMALVRLHGEAAGTLTEVNDAFAQITGCLNPATGEQSLSDVIDSADADRLASYLADIGEEGAPAERGELRIIGADAVPGWIRIVAAPVRNRSHHHDLAVVQIEDITAQRDAQERLAYLAVHDPLTGLPNRSLITDRIRQAQQRSERTGNHLGILFIDLDKFKVINDSFGHDAGDGLLSEIASRFHNTLRPSDTAARLGGDEFVVLCEDLSPDVAAAERELDGVAARLHQCLLPPIELGNDEVFVTASIGMNVFRGKSEEVRTELSNADIAMYRAKARGRSRSEPYDHAVRREAVDRLRLATDLHHALERHELTVVYQPIVDLPAGVSKGAEALLRWQHPELGNVPPNVFIDVAEDSELIVDLGEFVTDEVCRYLSRLNAADFSVSVNVSARQLNRADFVETLERSVRNHGLRPRQLAVELTENVLMDAAGSSLGQLNDLRALGVQVGVDDFGTGYASLTYLQKLPVSFVKVDRSFVDGVVDDVNDRTITKAVIQLAKALDLGIVAEGVETAGQARVLTELGCPHAQGYHFGHPLPPS